MGRTDREGDTHEKKEQCGGRQSKEPEATFPHRQGDYPQVGEVKGRMEYDHHDDRHPAGQVDLGKTGWHMRGGHGKDRSSKKHRL
jgi:hypothetical protein